jgi:tetratricopeptide (TPR) repeat protein
MRTSVGIAESNARKYLAREPDSLPWQALLYGSLFRLGDLDLDQYINDHDPKRFDQASAEYQESRAIADRVLAAKTATAGLAGASDLDGERFNLAFALNKVGEALQVKDDIDGALKKFNEALDQAVLIETSPRMDCKLQSATTKIKIAGVLMAKTPKDIDNALRNYTEAIEREEAIFANDKISNNGRPNNIVRSNLAAAYEGRAFLYEQNQDFDHAFKGYTDAASMFARLVDEDARDTKWLERLARVQHKFASALERYARSQGKPLDNAIEQYKNEVATREKLVEKEPKDPAWQKYLHESQERLQRVRASAAAPPAKPAAAE